jgi:NodT family efflux transporter outer membrane factor (OMF) lipoprotein
MCAGLVLLASAGCAVGPDFKRPSAPDKADYSPTPMPNKTVAAAVHGGEVETLVPGRDISADWWTVFHSPELNALISTAFAASPTIEAAEATLLGAQYDVDAQLGYFAPTLSASYAFQRQQLSGNESSNAPGQQGNGAVIAGAPNKPATFNLHTAQLTVGYTPDLFGGTRRQLEALQATANYQRFQLEAAYITLASNVVAAALQEASVRAQIAAANEIIKVTQEGVDILLHQQAVGYAMGIDVAAQQSALAQAQAALPPLQTQLEQTRDLIRTLAGGLPNADVPQTFTLDRLTLPDELPVSLPADLIEQRPDIRAAEEQWHQASAQVGVAVANRLPVIDITANAGGVATLFSQMFSTGGPFWNVTLAATQPIFDGFTLFNKQRSAEAALKVAAANYRGTVLTAFQNVADTLHAITSDDKALAAAVAAEVAAAVTLNLTREQNRVGYVNYLALLSAEQTYQTALQSRVQAQAARFGDAAALYQALGGGWWNRERPARTEG